MSYNWQRAPYLWEQRPFGIAFAVAMIGIGATVFWSLLI